MGQKVNPYGFRLGVTTDWKSRWFSDREYTDYLIEDWHIRDYLMRQLERAAVSRVEVERTRDRLRIDVHTARPGIVIGRRGAEADRLRADLAKITHNVKVQLNIQEIKQPELDAALIAQAVCDQLTGRVRVGRIAEAGPAALAALDRAGVDLKVVLIHSGFGESSYDTSGVGPENDAAALAAMTPKPDLVIVGHTHREIRDTVIKGVHFVQPKNWVQSLAVVHVSLAKDTARAGRYRVTAVRSDLIPLANVAESPRFTQRVRATHEAARLWAGTPIGRLFALGEFVA